MLMFFDEFIWIDRKKFLNEFWAQFEILRRTKELGAEVANHPTYGREPYIGDCLIWAPGAAERIGRESWLNPFASFTTRKTA